MRYSMIIIVTLFCFAILLISMVFTAPNVACAKSTGALTVSTKQSIILVKNSASHTANRANVPVIGETKKVSAPEEELSVEDKLRRDCPVADGFAFPVGAPDARGYYNAQPFGENFHLGEDWNGVRGGNSDFGDPIFAVADGIVFFNADIQNGWGKVVRILHNHGSYEQPKYIDSLYAHFDEIHVEEYQVVKKGQQIGTMGDFDGMYAAHLHFEMRSTAFMPIAGGYGWKKKGYLNPTKFIRKHP